MAPSGLLVAIGRGPFGATEVSPVQQPASRQSAATHTCSSVLQMVPRRGRNIRRGYVFPPGTRGSRRAAIEERQTRQAETSARQPELGIGPSASGLGPATAAPSSARTDAARTPIPPGLLMATSTCPPQSSKEPLKEPPQEKGPTRSYSRRSRSVGPYAPRSASVSGHASIP